MSAKKVLITGGAGFIGRALVKEFLLKGHDVSVLDDLSNGSRRNLEEFSKNKHFLGLIEGDIRDKNKCHESISPAPDIIIHAAAQINVQKSLDDPAMNFDINVVGTQNILEETRAIMGKKEVRFVVLGTCMVYNMASGQAISEKHPLKPASPYAASKLAGEFLVESYHYGYGLPVVILRPFNTYGPFQKTNMEGGVVSIFVKNDIEGKDLCIFGDGSQTRDLLFVDDCADFIYKASMDKKAIGQVFNAGTGKDVTINELAKMIISDPDRIRHITHHHPQSEVWKLQCDPAKAKRILKWKPKNSLKQGIAKLRAWLKESA